MKNWKKQEKQKKKNMSNEQGFDRSHFSTNFIPVYDGIIAFLRWNFSPL